MAAVKSHEIEPEAEGVLWVVSVFAEVIKLYNSVDFVHTEGRELYCRQCAYDVQ